MDSNRSWPTARLAGKDLPRGPELWSPADTGWTFENTDGLDLCEFVEATIRLTKGSRAGELVRLRAWQGDLYCDILRKTPDGYRLYTTYELWIPRKNSKSLLGSGLALDGLFDEMGAEVYSCAADKDQAKIVFKEVVAAVKASPELDADQGGLLKVYRDAIEYPAMGSVYRALSSEAFTKEGLNPSRVLFDELHAQPNDELWNVMNQGSGTREQPLIVALSTFGAKLNSQGDDSLGFLQYQYCKGVLAGTIDDPSFGCRIYESPADCDHLDQSVWYAANPALGDFLRVEDMEDRSRRMPETDFRTKRLNIWITSFNAWLPVGAWTACQSDLEIPEGADVWAAVDVALYHDSTAVVYVANIDGRYVVRSRVWKPAGGKIDVAEVMQHIRGLADRYHLQRVVYDPRFFDIPAGMLADENIPMEEVPQSPERMVPACGLAWELIVGGEVAHDGDPILEDHVLSAQQRPGERGWTLSKSKSSRKIDACIAMVMALAAAHVPAEDIAPFVLVG